MARSPEAHELQVVPDGRFYLAPAQHPRNKFAPVKKSRCVLTFCDTQHTLDPGTNSAKLCDPQSCGICSTESTTSEFGAGQDRQQPRRLVLKVHPTSWVSVRSSSEVYLYQGPLQIIRRCIPRTHPAEVNLQRP